MYATQHQSPPSSSSSNFARTLPSNEIIQSLDPDEALPSSSQQQTRFGSTLTAPSSHSFSSTSSTSSTSLGQPTRYHAVSSTDDNFGHFRANTPSLATTPGVGIVTAQQYKGSASSNGGNDRVYSHTTLQSLGPYKVRDLFQSHALRRGATRKEVVAATQKELYVPRTSKLLKQDDFIEFNEAGKAYLETIANSTPHARAKAAMRGGNGNGAAGGGMSMTQPIPDMIDSAAAAAKQSSSSSSASSSSPSDSYLQSIWFENRTKEASDERLRKHIKQLVHEWSGRLSRFEEESQRRQEDVYYAKYKREKEMAVLEEEEKTNHSQHHSHVVEDPLTHHRSTAYSLSTQSQNGKTIETQEAWSLGTDAVLDAKQSKAQKELLKRRKQLTEQRAMQSDCTSTLGVKKEESSLSKILGEMEGPSSSMLYGHNNSNSNNHNDDDDDDDSEQKGGEKNHHQHLTFSTFRPTTTPARTSEGGLGDASAQQQRPVSQGGSGSSSGNNSKLPYLSAMAQGLAVRSTNVQNAFGDSSQQQSSSSSSSSSSQQPHIFSSHSHARTAGIIRPEYTSVISTPHIRKRTDLFTCNNIKYRLATEDISVSRGIIERALIPPEVVFTQEEKQRELPQPFYSLPQNPFEGHHKKKAVGNGAASGKKTAGSKKKKKGGK